MKTFRFLLLSSALMFVGSAFAADPAATPAPGPHQGKAAHGGKMRRRLQMNRQIARRLELTPDQVSKLKASRAATASALKAIRADASLSTEQKKEKARATLQAARAEMRGVLTQEQLRKLQHLRARRLRRL